jgi:hypothetical protein
VLESIDGIAYLPNMVSGMLGSCDGFNAEPIDPRAMFYCCQFIANI